MTRQTRREFLEETLFAAAAAALAGTAATQSVQAQEQSTSPSERLRVAVIGSGVVRNARGTVHIDEWAKRQDCEIVAVCDADEAAGPLAIARVERSTGKRPTFYQDLRKLLDDKSIHAVSIATPNHWHALAAIWAMQAGKDVYVEKPVSHNVSEGRRIVDTARKHGRICQAGTQSRSAPKTREMMEFLHSGGIGEIKLARGLCYKPRKSIGTRGNYEIPKGVDFDVWAGPAPMKPLTRPSFHYDWHWDWDYGNGDIGNQGPHQMDLARWGLGVEGLGYSVLSYGGRVGYEDAGDTANTQVAIYDYGEKSIVFEVRGLNTEALTTARIGVIYYGSKGYAVHGGRNPATNTENGYSGGVIFDLDGNVVRTFAPESNADRNSVTNHFENFVKTVRSRKSVELHADIEVGHVSCALSHLGNISYRLGEMLPVSEIQKRLEQAKRKDEALATLERVKQHLVDNHLSPESTQFRFGSMLTVDARAEKFTGTDSAKANVLLSREYRKGFEVPASAQLA
jgi:predicted dehydrogenase